MMQGASFTERTISRISIGGSLLPILLLAMIIVAVVIVTIILVVVVVGVIVGVVIVVVSIGIVIVVMMIGVVVIIDGDVSHIIKLSFVIIGFLQRVVLYYLIHQPLSYISSFLQSLRF